MTFVSDPEQLLDCWQCGALPKLTFVSKLINMVANLFLSQSAGIATHDDFPATYDTCLHLSIFLWCSELLAQSPPLQWD